MSPPKSPKFVTTSVTSVWIMECTFAYPRLLKKGLVTLEGFLDSQKCNIATWGNLKLGKAEIFG